MSPAQPRVHASRRARAQPPAASAAAAYPHSSAKPTPGDRLWATGLTAVSEFSAISIGMNCPAAFWIEVPSGTRIRGSTNSTPTTALMAGEILAFVAFGVGEAVLKNPAPHASLGQPGVLRAVLMAGAYPAMIGLIGLGLGALIRHTAGAISAVVGVLFVLPLILVPLGTSIQNTVGRFMPMPIAENSLTAVKPVPHSLSPGLGFALLGLYAAGALVAGGWALARRDA